MYVAITGSGKARVIQFREDTRIPGTTKKKTHVVKTIGNYERMLAEDPDIIAKLKAEAAELTGAKKESSAPLSFSVTATDITSPQDVVPSFRFGHALIKQLWSNMGLDSFFLDNCGKRNATAISQGLFYLVAHRCGDPCSIHASASEQNSYAGIIPLGIDVLYDVLDVLSNQKEAVIRHLADFFEKRTSRSGPEAYYDVTTYAFESTRWGELRIFGFSKDQKNNEVQVVMGLLLDNNGIPITYELFPGNTIDQCTLTRSVEKLKNLYRLEKITVVADRELNSGSNLDQLKAAVKRGCNQFLQMELDTENWKLDELKIEEAARYDGYYAVITNNLTLSTDQVSKICGGLWKIEENFRILKTDLRARPILVWC